MASRLFLFGSVGACLLLLCLFGCASEEGPAQTITDGSGKEIHVGGLATFRYWANSKPGPETKVLNGQYWSSSHFTKEYIMFLELRASWAEQFASENHLLRASGKVDVPSDAPNWFVPPSDFEVWTGSQGSLYYIEPVTGHMYIYEVQL